MYNRENKGECIMEDNTIISPKKKRTTLLLSIFLGGVGAHKFYIGRVFEAISRIILTVISILAGNTYDVLEATATTENNTLEAIGVIAALSWFYLIAIYLVDLVLIVKGKFRDSNGYLIQ